MSEPSPTSPTSPPTPPSPQPPESSPSASSSQDEATRRVERIEAMLVSLLRIGVIASTVTVLAGVAVSLARHPDYITDPHALTRLMQPGAAFPHTLAELGRELMQGRGRAIVTLGLLLLILTPAVRVAACVVAFGRQRDWIFAALTAIVLAVLVFAFITGKVG